MAEAGQRLRAVLDGYANFLGERELALPKHQPYLVRWVREFLHFAREHIFPRCFAPHPLLRRFSSDSFSRFFSFEAACIAPPTRLAPCIEAAAALRHHAAGIRRRPRPNCLTPCR